MVLAGRYEVKSVVGEAAFSTALSCTDVEANKRVCVKVIKNNKDYFDQSLDEIRLLKYINSSCKNPDAKHIIRMYDYFYHKEHLFIVTELLDQNLYAMSRDEMPLRGTKSPNRFFTLGNVRKIARQCLEALVYISSLGIIHCDIKPENIMVADRENVRIKVIDFGSSCFTTDRLSSYIQSRFYRAPEVILGCNYDHRIDVWSLGACIAEICTGDVLFESSTTTGLLATIVGVLGPFSRSMVRRGRFSSKWLLGDVIYERDEEAQSGAAILYPRRQSLHRRLGSPSDSRFLDFIRTLLTKDPRHRPSADMALRHPWLLDD
mmetsp:Transcript_10736/g.30444  ORF Transcript_10736/g.30444 Transcript_10736/m.30444 type:complete len:319 (+) Transcript_10736:3-959(+)